LPVRLTRLLTKLPVPERSFVLLFAVVGPVVVFQQTPREVTVAPPSFVIFPPLVAVVAVMELIAVVDRVGTNGLVVKLRSFPYAVPALLAA
jgi:hypothetical protein